MKGILSTLFFLALVLLPSIVKVVKEMKKGTPPPHAKRPATPSNTHRSLLSELEEKLNKTDSEMRKKEPKVPKEPDYFTYETLDSQSQEKRIPEVKNDEEILQSVENEEEGGMGLTMSEEEIYKGIIYSEILKRKVN